MERVRQAGLEVVALADHNDASWTDFMVEAGRNAGIVVFPGVEVTTGSGADGVHLVIIGDRDRTRDDLNAVLAATCGYSGDHPPFDPVHHTPASSPRTAIDILDALPDGYLVIAPHAFNDNGVASSRSVMGDIRWKILHHDRLGAVDVGDVRGLSDPSSWHHKFAARALSNFPCLSYLPFVSTSDTYSLDRLGGRWTWIRMSAPTLEGLRQAFLDFEARIVCDWDPRYSGTATPNNISHRWVEDITISGLSTSETPVRLNFNPRLNVLIGGRGAGKSTIVAALRCLYGDPEGLPPQARAELGGLLTSVFGNATVEANHRLAHSAEKQRARWTPTTKSLTHRESVGDPEAVPEATPTDFKVRIINQKELFERAAHSSTDPFATARNLLTLVDDALATGSAAPGSPSAFDAALNEAQTAWISAARAHQGEIEATAQRDVVAARVGELQRQVAAFDSSESRSRRERNDRVLAEQEALTATIDGLRSLISSWEAEIEASLAEPPKQEIPTENSAAAKEYLSLNQRLEDIRATLREALAASLLHAREALTTLEEERDVGVWQVAATEAAADAEKYKQELAALGVDPAEYDRVRAQLGAQTELLGELDERRGRLPELASKVGTAWADVESLLATRRQARNELLKEVAARSSLLRFTIVPRSDLNEWTRRVRELLNLRADGFLPDVPALARWLWGGADEAERNARGEAWRTACITGNFRTIATAAQLRSSWVERLSGLDPVLRARLGSEVADDTVEMDFLIEGGNAQVESDWKPLTAGSPGQRSAAMLSFVLHHGVEPLVLDQPEDDLDTEWITQLVVRQLRTSRWVRQLIVVTHNANIPVNADAERVIVMETHAGGIRVRESTASDGSGVEHSGALEDPLVRKDVQQIMEGGVAAFVGRELRYNNELNSYRAAMRSLTEAS
jgi:energy-coupling factor transporter ATP-binding protein EcfA2